MKSCKYILFALTFFLCACGAAEKENPVAKPGLNAIIRDGKATVYKRSVIDKLAPAEKAYPKPFTPETDNDSGAASPQRSIKLEKQQAAHYASDEIPLTKAERAKKVSDAVTGIKGIEKATVAISGSTAIIGIKHIGRLDDMMFIKLKKEIDDIAKAADGGIRSVAVTATPELVERVEKMSNSETTDLTVY